MQLPVLRVVSHLLLTWNGNRAPAALVECCMAEMAAWQGPKSQIMHWSHGCLLRAALT